MNEFQARLNQARNGGGLLFCGAGFTADCLNFDEDLEIGTGVQLLKILNDELEKIGASHGFRDLKNAADKYQQEKGELELMNLLCGRFRLQKVTADIVDILRYPWEQIYTTNYDNGIELGLHGASKKAISVNNLEDPISARGQAVIHLHGYIEKWTLETFRKSCILGAESYYLLPGVRKWLDKLRLDIERSQFVAFVGFNASDFHLAQVLFNVSDLRKKIYFINRPAAKPDPDIGMTQERFGCPLYIGRQDFAKIINRILELEAPTEPSVASFRRYEPPLPSSNVPGVSEIEDLFIFGRVISEQLARDIRFGRSDYHVIRELTEQALEAVGNGVRILLLIGEICDGKTIVVEDLCNRLSVSRPVYRLRHSYDDLLDEVSRILEAKPDAALVVENCFDIRSDRLVSIARILHGSEGVLLLTSRDIAAEADITKVDELGHFTSFREMRFSRLKGGEVEALESLIDQIAGWRSLSGATKAERFRFIEQGCGGSLPGFLLRLLKSDYVRQRYQEEFNKSLNLQSAERHAIVAALYITHVGYDAPIELLSEAVQFDVGIMLDRLGRDEVLRLVRRHGEYVKTVPAIGATNILEHMIPDVDIVDSVLLVLESLAEGSYPDDFERHIFGQLMRYSILRSVVSSKAQIDRFFDHISKIEYFRRRVLFWLQWHMAKADFKEFPKAWEYLDQGYSEADAYERKTGNKFNRKQLDDRKAKFYMLRAQHEERSPVELFREMKESWEIVGRLLKNEGATRHPFQTLQGIGETFFSQSHKLNESQRDAARNALIGVGELALERLNFVPAGYQRSAAAEALQEFRSLIGLSG